MKYFILAAICFLTLNAKGQNPCEYSANVSDSIGTYKNTRDHLVYERNFAGTSSNMYFSLALTDGMPTLNMQFIQKSKDFIIANCLDKNSRVYLQLDNGKIVSLFHIDQENCGTTVRDGEGRNIRILNGYFMFVKEGYEELKKSPVSVMRIRYATESVDYIFRENLTSEIDSKTYHPGSYFINTLHCIEN